MLKTRLPVNQTHVKDPRQSWILDSTPWNPDSTIKHFLDSAIRIALHGRRLKTLVLRAQIIIRSVFLKVFFGRTFARHLSPPPEKYRLAAFGCKILKVIPAKNRNGLHSKTRRT